MSQVFLSLERPRYFYNLQSLTRQNVAVFPVKKKVRQSNNKAKLNLNLMDHGSGAYLQFLLVLSEWEFLAPLDGTLRTLLNDNGDADEDGKEQK